MAWRDRAISLSIILCIVLTATWAAVLALSTFVEPTPIKLIESAEATRNGAWMFLLHGIYGFRIRGASHVLAYRNWIPWYAAGILLVFIILYGVPGLLALLGAPKSFERNFNYFMWVCFAVAALVVTEQIYRLSNQTERWVMKHLCLALSCIFGYDFAMYSEALIMQRLDPMMWDARGVVVAVCAPLIATTVMRSRKHTEDVQVSPNVVFHTFMLFATGVYLVYLAGVGYIIHHLGGTWSGFIQIIFLSSSGVAFVMLVTSSRVRSMVRVWLSKHFFSYRYDYRREWLDFTEILAQRAEEAPHAVIQAMAKLCDSPSGLLWMRTDGGSYTLIDHWQMKEPDVHCDLSGIERWLKERVWTIDIHEWQENRRLYGKLEIPQEVLNIPDAWLIVPLMFKDRVQGILLLCRPETPPQMNWEDRDLLKIAGRAAATHLALYQADNALVELRQFEGFNRLSAYVVHDLKNILAQQSLIVYNAEQCRDEPEFMDDVIETIRHSVERMKRLMAQMRSGVRGADRQTVYVGELLEAVIADNTEKPKVTFMPTTDDYAVTADPDQLSAVFSHIMKNAQEATDDQGRVTVSLERSGNQVKIKIEDNGAGMDTEFIKHRLFKPFDTTKGLTGMGIGAYESREYVRALGGEIMVNSVPRIGSCFTISLPCIASSEQSTAQSEVAQSG